MGKHNETGTLGEKIAAEFLLNKGYEIHFRNWRSGKMEVDIIASYDNQWIFLEVKTRQLRGQGFPEEAVTERKKAHLRTAAEAFFPVHPEFPTLRYDIISVEIVPDGSFEIRHYEDAFY